ncbi:ribonucleoside-diphosphate reductase, alpha subunit [Thermocrinis albus DSM 14484]|uniref:Ribonucleoside-diphosphate reductase n=1 Tax=Thermocrinis albus (strain DSM 14484 / JCM 11386 / HI 11/12) TaxID=638303 RepID=D3SQ85_THEAH|nr:ribonucleoside-diphosphate reductase subunit alpha [Thermocrinis albus]ADC89322.1 ribonucleoside-diphosphate reductase, alpha subunit [Thermocrinis albus DSM 14484]
MKVIKRSGRREELDISKIRIVIDFACAGLDVDPLELEMDAQIQFRDNITTREIQQLLIRTAAEKVSPETPDWTYVAARLLLYDLYKDVGHLRGYKVKDKINGKYRPYNPESFYHLIKTYTDRGIYGGYLLENYTKEEIDQLAQYIKPERDLLFNYTGIKVLSDRYLVRDEEGRIIELPQEMYMLIAMTLGIAEKKEERLEWVKKFYDVLSQHYVSLATPTMMNARRTHTQLSSCFVLTVDDDLYDIFDNVQKAAQISKFAGGLGIYLGKIRATGAPIRKFRGASSGVLPVVKIINDVMVYVDQLGMRKGSASITLDIWHKDVLDFLEVKTNVGDERKKAHDIHPAVAIPDLFMERVRRREKWTLMDPYYCKKVKDGKNLEDFYGKEFEEVYLRLEKELPPYAKREVDAWELWKRLLTVIFETGEPYIFFRDTANYLNPNKHCGMVYSSNLCMEIIQNMSVTTHEEDILEEDGRITHRKRSGDVVVCNLGSINLGLVYTAEDLAKVMPVLVRMLDNVISINFYAIKEAEYTNKRYRAIGIGVSNYHYCLVKNGIQWESEEHIKFADALFERIAYYAIKASCDLAKERGKYPLFDGSDWSKGIFFGRTPEENQQESVKNGNHLDWIGLAKEVKEHGLRNGYLLAVMPTGSTSLIIGATASVDPIFAKFYKEENMSGILPQVPPEIKKYFWHYKSAYHIDQEWSIRAAAARQKWIDQSQSFNLYIDPEKIDGPTLSHLYQLAHQLGLKTVYYCRSKSITDIEECESCST